MGIVKELQDTTIDLVIAGHTHRIANTVVGQIPVVEGVNAGGSYSVAQLMVEGRRRGVGGRGDAHGQEPRRRPRPDVQAIVDEANADTAVLRNQVIGTQTGDIQRDTRRRLKESAMGNLVADAMRAEVPRRATPRSPTRAVCARTCWSLRRRRASSRARSRGARRSPCCRSATAR